MDLQPDLGFDSLEEICHVNVATYAICSKTPADGYFCSGESGTGLVAVLRAELLLKDNVRHLLLFNLNNLHTSEYS